ncbi:MAG: 16S rRNA (uracil(1498)-N(3))-methyltransferase [Spirochaetia bacterium]|nr:16S rRNA (uracil(1498)-N(3))-methyltransferase [Spirochaetia bacterium]
MNIILFTHLDAENSLPLFDHRALHIRKILKLGVGGQFLAGEINSVKGLATILSLDAESLHFSFKAGDPSKPLYPVTLMVAQVRPICMRRILREAVSLGVSKILLTGSDTTEKSYADAKLYADGEYRSILLDGAMQSGETGVSEVVFSNTLDEAIGLTEGSGTRIVLDNVMEAKSLSSLPSPQSPVVLAIGGERGFTNRERSLFLSSGFIPASLGERILRTETAASAGLAVLLGRMNLL